MLDLNKCYNNDCLDGLKELEDNSVDLITTDPPYFLINESGSGFMGKEWDSINIDTGSELLLKSKEFVNFVARFFLSMKVELSMGEENTAQQSVKTKILNQNQIKKLVLNANSVEKNTKDTNLTLSQDINSVQTIVITKDVLLGYLRESSPSRTGESQDHICLLENLSENASFAVPVSYIMENLTDIVQESALKFPTENVCLERKIRLTLMDEVKINGVIEGMIGSKSGCPFTYETNSHVSTAGNTVEEEKFNAITLKRTESHKTMNWIIWLLFVIFVIQKSSGDKKLYTKKDLGYALISLFNESWLKECLRVLKPGAFAFIMSAPRQDVLSRMIVNIEDAGFKTDFTSIYWTYASGMPKALNIEKAVKKKLGEDAPEAEALAGTYSGFNPKPAVEIVIVAMKPLQEKSYTDQALSNTHGVTWLDNCRIPYKSEKDIGDSKGNFKPLTNYDGRNTNFEFGIEKVDSHQNSQGRFPANLLCSSRIDVNLEMLLNAKHVLESEKDSRSK